MEVMVDTPVRQSAALPSISHMGDSSHYRRDSEEQLRRHGPPLTSPSLFHVIDSRRTSAEDHRPIRAMRSPPSASNRRPPPQSAPQQTRQSLPSIHEALKQEPTYNYPGPPPPPTPKAPSTSSAYFPLPAPTAPADAVRREVPSFPKAPPPPLSQIGAPSTPTHPPASRSNSLPGPNPLPGTPMFSSQAAEVPALQSITSANSPPSNVRTSLAYPQHHPAPPPYQTLPISAPPNGSFAFSGYQSPYQYPSAKSAGQIYAPPPSSISTSPQYPLTPGLVDTSGKRELRPMKAYDQSVKRKFEQFDLESSLFELSACGGRIREYSHSAAVQAQEARSAQHASDIAITHVTMEHLDQLSKDITNIQRSYSRLSELVHASHKERQDHQKDMQRQYPNGYGSEGNNYGRESPESTPVLQPDQKKRRGRAAPPGRCHSCNRAETPEWRRGPDGARTLCNACGLHYAKLTRKLGANTANTKSYNISNSHLRPKDGPEPPN